MGPSPLLPPCSHARTPLTTPSSPSVVVLLILLPYLPFTLLLALRTTSTRRGRPYLALYQLAAFHTLLGLALWALAVVVLTPAGSPADAPGSPEAEEEGYELVRREDAGEGGPGGQVMAKASTGGQRWCKRCAAPKPDRCVRRPLPTCRAPSCRPPRALYLPLPRARSLADQAH